MFRYQGQSVLFFQNNVQRLFSTIKKSITFWKVKLLKCQHIKWIISQRLVESPTLISHLILERITRIFSCCVFLFLFFILVLHVCTVSPTCISLKFCILNILSWRSKMLLTWWKGKPTAWHQLRWRRSHRTPFPNGRWWQRGFLPICSAFWNAEKKWNVIHSFASSKK